MEKLLILKQLMDKYDEIIIDEDITLNCNDIYLLNKDIKISGNYRVGDIKDNLADLTKINSVLGYKPKYDFKTGISNFVDWVENEKIEPDNYEKSIEEMKRKGLYK